MRHTRKKVGVAAPEIVEQIRSQRIIYLSSKTRTAAEISLLLNRLEANE